MVPRVEEFERMEVYGHVPDEILAGFAEQGFALTAMPAHNVHMPLSK